METAIKNEVVYGTFLQDRIVAVKPVESQGKWNTLLASSSENKNNPFLYNKVKRSYDVPLNSESLGGGVKTILDDQKRVKIAKYAEKYPLGMTQKEFFENELNVTLNTAAKSNENFWRVDRNGRVILTKEGIKLNLNLPLDMLKYLILLSNERTICPSYDNRNDKATYEFMLVDESKVTVKKLEQASIKSKAYIKFAEITQSKKSTVAFIKSLGRTIPATATDDWLKNEILTVIENSPSAFLDTVNHPQYQEKIFVQEAIEVGAIIRKGDKRYTLDNGVELGDLTDTIGFLLNPENQETKLRIKAKVDLATRK